MSDLTFIYTPAFLSPSVVSVSSFCTSSLVNINNSIDTVNKRRHRYNVVTRKPIPRAKPCSTRMLQNPNSDGPPSLGDLDIARQATSTMQGPAIVFSTSRVSVREDEEERKKLSDIMKENIDSAISKLQTESGVDMEPELIHITYTPDFSVEEISAALPDVPYRMIGRSIAKEGGTKQTIEVLMLSGGSSFDMGVGISNESSKDSMTKALENRTSKEDGIFNIFMTSDLINEEQIRNEISSNIPSYGGKSSTLFIKKPNEQVIMINEENSQYVSCIVSIDGSSSFLISAVIKSWTQPKFVHPLEFLVPKYQNNAPLDLLEAIKFDDWDMFIQCIEDQKVDVNYQWATRQHQTPLLASAGRGRTRLIQYLLDNGADVNYRNDGGYNAVMYTLRLKEYGDDFVQGQLDILEKAGADLNDTDVIIPPPRD